MNLCMDCKFCIPNENIPEVVRHSMCAKYATVCPVTGIIAFNNYCEVMRVYDCGSKGKHFDRFVRPPVVKKRRWWQLTPSESP